MLFQKMTMGLENYAHKMITVMASYARNDKRKLVGLIQNCEKKLTSKHSKMKIISFSEHTPKFN